MGNKKTICLLILLGLFYSGHGQFYESYDWEDPMDPPTDTLDKIILKKREVVEFVFEENSFLEYYLLHEIDYINSDDQVEKNNKKFGIIYPWKKRKALR